MATAARRPSATQVTRDPVASVLTLDDGTLAVVSNSRPDGHGYDVRLEVHGSLDAAAAEGCTVSRREGRPVRDATVWTS